MDSRNRSDEFKRAVSFLKPLIPNACPLKKEKIPNIFLQEADTAKRSCVDSASKLQEFELLIRNQCFHNDQSYEINVLLEEVKKFLNASEDRIRHLERLLSGAGFLNYHLQTHCYYVVSHLKEKQLLLTAHLKYLLENYTRYVKKKENRIKVFSDSVERSFYAFPAEISDGDRILQDENIQFPNCFHLKSVHIEEAESCTYELKKIESTIVDLGNMFNTLTMNVKQQGEVLNRIDSNVEIALTNVDMAHGHLLRYFRTVYQSRDLLLKVLATVSIVLVTAVVLFG